MNGLHVAVLVLTTLALAELLYPRQRQRPVTHDASPRALLRLLPVAAIAAVIGWAFVAGVFLFAQPGG